MNNLLTAELVGINITSPFPHEAVGIRTSEITGQQRPLLSVVFLCPSKIISTGLIRIKSFMVGCIRHPLGWSVPVTDSSNLILTRHPTIRTKGWRLYSKYRRNRNA